MKRSGTCSIKVAKWWVMALLQLSLCLGAAGCSLFKASDSSSTTTGRTIWHSGQQNVRIERQDTKGTGPNDHPIVLAPDQIRGALATLEVRLKPAERTVPVFTKSEIEPLGNYISDGLAEAGPDQDVTFAVIGHRKALYGLAKERKVTTGRVFYRDGKLNIIFGRMIDDIGQYDGVSAKPITTGKPSGPGERIKPVSHSWVLELSPDMQFHGEAGMYRTDWVELDLAAIAAHESLGIKPTKAGRTAGEEAGTARGEAAPQAGRQTPAPAEPAQAVPQAGKTTKTVEERLTILNDLKNKKLITDEEYKAKRAEILKDL